MWSFIVVMVLILALAAAVVTYVAFPYRGYEVPGGQRAAQVSARVTGLARQGVVRARGALAQAKAKKAAAAEAAPANVTPDTSTDAQQVH